MRDWVLLAATAAGAGVIACLGTRALVPLLRRAAVLDRPNERSSHAAPTPRGGGIAVVGAILLAWLGLIVAGQAAPSLIAVVLGAALLAAVSWRDDVGGLAPAVRLAAQCIAVALALGMLVLIGAEPLSQGWLPRWLDLAVTALLWLWFINLFNFMDGIDGIAGSEAAAVAIGLVLFAAVGVGHDARLAILSATIAAAAFGFVVWNWAPARIFLGDVGSVPLGFLLGFLLLGVAADGHWKIALILPLYFLADATITLCRRLVRGERVWQPHRQHFYQRAVQRGLGHAEIVQRVIAADVALVGCGWAAENGWGNAALGAAAAVVLVLLLSLAGAWSRRPPRLG
jgi:UDP-N-acetylmuramyl pentapeptide phosphotransferase/UDP-N-acetylglucosamine-1-phosphate transferase